MSEMPVNKAKCATCPFREGSPYAHLAIDLAISALTNRSRICHSTGSNNGINKKTGRAARICRGARDVQIEYLFSIGFLKAKTDEAWTAKLNEIEEGEVRWDT